MSDEHVGLAVGRAVEALSLVDRCRSHVVVTDYGCWVEGLWKPCRCWIDVEAMWW